MRFLAKILETAKKETINTAKVKTIINFYTLTYVFFYLYKYIQIMLIYINILITIYHFNNLSAINARVHIILNTIEYNNMKKKIKMWESDIGMHLRIKDIKINRFNQLINKSNDIMLNKAEKEFNPLKYLLYPFLKHSNLCYNFVDIDG